jgi:hypothetical protein
VEVKPANAADNDFLQQTITNTEAIVGKVENINADGAYNSKENQEFVNKKGINFILSGLQGKESNYGFIFDDIGNVTGIKNIQTNQTHSPHVTKKGDYRITEEGKSRYFKQNQIDSFKLREHVNQIPQSEKNRRNNIESTMFHYVYPLRNNKTKYRGIIKNKAFANCRCLWINLVKIKNFMGEDCKKSQKSPISSQTFAKLFQIIAIWGTSWKNLTLPNLIIQLFLNFGCLEPKFAVCKKGGF